MGEVTTALEAWNIAALRLEDYLRAHRVHDREHLLRLNLALLEEAHRLHATQPDSTPLAVTMNLATAHVEAWFSRLVDQDATSDPQLAARGRAAWFASGLHRQWPTAFLDSSPPEELLTAVSSASLQAGPALDFSSLLRTEVDYGPMEDLAGGTWQQFSWGHVLRAFFIWVVIFFAAYGAYLGFFQRP